MPAHPTLVGLSGPFVVVPLTAGGRRIADGRVGLRCPPVVVVVVGPATLGLFDGRMVSRMDDFAGAFHDRVPEGYTEDDDDEAAPPVGVGAPE